MLSSNGLFLPTLLLLLSTLSTLTSAHLSMRHPPPIKLASLGGPNKYANPLKSDGSDFPCKGLFKVGDPKADLGPSVTSWRAGEDATFELERKGAAAHWGGSCQASISYDFGKTWQVLRSYVGGCPRGANENNIDPKANLEYKFKMPNDAPGGKAIFAWTYFTVTGFREMYMNCAHVTVLQADSAVTKKRLDDNVHPPMFVGEINKCKSHQWFNLEFPRLGPNPHFARDTYFQQRKPHGQC